MRKPTISRTITFYAADCTVVNKTTGETSRMNVKTSVNTDKARNEALPDDVQLCFTHNVDEVSGKYSMPLDKFIELATLDTDDTTDEQ